MSDNIDPFAIAVDGWVDSEGDFDAFTISANGWVVEVTVIPPEEGGGFRIKRIDDRRVKVIGGGLPETESYKRRPKAYSIEEEEEILMIIKIFLDNASKGLFD